MSSPRSDYIPALQGMRGLAAFVVMLAHPLGTYDAPYSWRLFANLFDGAACVVIFFVLSGYVLALSFGNAHPLISVRKLATYYLRRAFRLYPALIVANLLGLLYFTQVRHFGPIPPESSYWFAELDRLVNSKTIVLSFLGLDNLLDHPSWTIEVEVFGSLLVPFFVYVALRFRSVFFGITAGLLLLSQVGQHSGPIAYSIEFAVGVLIYALRDSGLALAWERSRWMKLLPPFAVFFLVIAVDLNELGLPLSQVHLINLAGGTLLVGSVVLGKQSFRILTSRWAIWLGDISYSVYLLHFAVMLFLMKAFSLAWPHMAHGQQLILPSLLLAAFTGAITLPLAAAAHRYVEKPGIRLGGRMAQIIAGKNPALKL